MLYAIIGLLVVILDQAVKYWAAGAIDLESTGEVFIPGILSLVNLHNDGAAFSFLAGSGARIPFIIITGVFIVLVIIALATKFISGRFARWCLVLVTAGGLSNCIDRVIYGYVQDMFKCELFNFPVFNVADVFITVFAILFALAVLFERKSADDEYDDEFSDEDDEDDDYEDEEDDRPSRRARKAQKREDRRAAKAAARKDLEDEDEEPVRPVRKSRKERAEEAYAQARAEQKVARTETPARKAEAPARKAAEADDPFAEWERANARAASQQSGRSTARPVQSAPAAKPATPAAKPAAATAPAAKPAVSAKPAAAAPAAKPAARPTAAKKPAPAVEEDFSLDDILAEFK